ncbi:carboxymuconolactone decarboxylase family protein [Novosphingobium sp. M1R2S20]|uniref:Carboxymuconolactone decarboxylase family protein n=1 Tax=Novosphingobium rhizovicinum TaxID=3228928 RepID=A0ABV3RFF5_9SPHN
MREVPPSSDQLALDTQIQARHEEILGAAPRIAPRERSAVAEQVIADTNHLLCGITGSDQPPQLPLNSIPEIMFTLCRFPDLWRSIMDVTVQLQGPGSCLPPRDRKLAILRTGWLCQAPYEYGEHVNQARRMGFTTDEIERIRTGSEAPGWDRHERAILRAVEELHAGAMVSDATWTELASTFDDRQTFELLVLVGQFTATAYFQNALKLRLEPGNPGLATG